ncbi:MAG: iron-sulfur cluster assembly scaffold protein [Syntrophobacter sp.]
MVTSMNELMATVYGQSFKKVENPDVDQRPQPVKNMKRIENASARGKITGHCGETMEIYLCIDGEHIRDASFFTDGCRFSVICGSIVALLAKGKTVDEAAEIGGDTVLGLLQGVPEGETHCAYLAAETLHSAIHEWMLTVPG